MAASRVEPLRAAAVRLGGMDPAARRRALTLTGVVAAAGVLVWLGTPVCPTALFLGVPCPGCGLTRATLALFRGDFAEALHFHPLVPVLAPLFFGALAKAGVDYVRGPTASGGNRPTWWTGRMGIALGAFLLVLVVGVWGLRFAGFFGGPVPVESLAALKARHFGR